MGGRLIETPAPAVYAPLPVAVQLLLAHSVGSKTLVQPDSREFMGSTLWEFLDTYMSASQIQTLVQVHDGATRSDLWKHIDSLKSVYAGSSWGIEFNGPGAAIRARLQAFDFCHDIDRFVRPSHGNTAHTWWRNIGPRIHDIGHIHVGLSDGAGYHNFHFDGTNPAEGRGSFFNDQRCNYSSAQVIYHNYDIRVGARGAVSDFLLVEKYDYFFRRSKEALQWRGPFWEPLRENIEGHQADRDKVMAELRRISVLPGGQALAEDFVAGGDLVAFKDWLGVFLNDFINQVRRRGKDIRFFPQRDTGGDRKRLLYGIQEILTNQGPKGLSFGHLDGLIGIYFEIRQAGG